MTNADLIAALTSCGFSPQDENGKVRLTDPSGRHVDVIVPKSGKANEGGMRMVQNIQAAQSA